MYKRQLISSNYEWLLLRAMSHSYLGGISLLPLETLGVGHQGFESRSVSQIHACKGGSATSFFVVVAVTLNESESNGQVQHPITFSPRPPKRLPMGRDRFSESGELR